MKKLIVASLVAALGVSHHANAQIANFLKQLEKAGKQIESPDQKPASDKRAGQAEFAAVNKEDTSSQKRAGSIDNAVRDYVSELSKTSYDKSMAARQVTAASDEVRADQYFPNGSICRTQNIRMGSLIEEGFYKKASAKADVDKLLSMQRQRASFASGNDRYSFDQCVSTVEYLREQIKEMVARIEADLPKVQQESDKAQIAELQTKINEHIEKLISQISAEVEQQKRLGYRLDPKYF